MTLSNKENSTNLANAIRGLAIDAVEKAKSGHPGLPLGTADIVTALAQTGFNYNPQKPDWINRDRFILSAGHGSMLLYAFHYLLGTDGLSLDDLKNFRQYKSNTPGHPEYGYTNGVETTTGPLGQGISTAVGMAASEAKLRQRFGEDIISHYTYVLASDGDLMEGISHEALSLAGHLKLNKLIVFFDDNGITIDGKVSLSDSTDQVMRLKSYGWNVISVDGHNHNELQAAIKSAKENDSSPTLIACKTTIGYGSPNKANSSGVHGSPLGDDELKATKEALGLRLEPFSVDENIRQSWLDIGSEGKKAYEAWLNNFNQKPDDVKTQFNNFLARKLPSDLTAKLSDYLNNHEKNQKPIATRVASQVVLEFLNTELDNLMGGSADLTGSNNTKTKTLQIFNSDNYDGNYIYYGIREHAMAAFMNGMMLHSGFKPYGGTFLVFSDYCRGAIRLSALMKLGVVYVFTHDSIGLGEDGPTHQPVEHLSALRAMPNLNVFRPCDVVETAESWLLALENNQTPSVLALTRQNLEQLRESLPASTNELKSRNGAYELYRSNNLTADAAADVLLIATGSEVEIMQQVAKTLEENSKTVRLISAPCLDIFYSQDKAYKAKLLGNEKLRVVCEAGVRQSWDRILRDDDMFFGVETFGESAPYKKLYEHFGLTSENISAEILKSLNN